MRLDDTLSKEGLIRFNNPILEEIFLQRLSTCVVHEKYVSNVTPNANTLLNRLALLDDIQNRFRAVEHGLISVEFQKP